VKLLGIVVGNAKSCDKVCIKKTVHSKGIIKTENMTVKLVEKIYFFWV
jgi:hypothetical protein